ncbi:MAG: endonuclease/exonuclease/phosphatase family protein [Proteobacteria bacterium]|nr:endonuclease/exonuclease/phosphatase family protein [Pseudomonadota bacterium]
MIKVASYNIRKGIGTDRIRSPDRILHVLREIDADVIALQEADRRFGRRAAILAPHHLEAHSPWKAVPFGEREHSAGWHGNVLLVRKDAHIADCEPIHLPTLEPRGAVTADLRINGERVRIVGMHLDLSGLMRRRQADAILAHLDASAERLPTVMMGDLNEWTRHSGCLKDFAQRFTIAATGPSFHARRPVGRLDRIMTSPEFRITDCGVHHSPASRAASDHLPIWARIEPA